MILQTVRVYTNVRLICVVSTEHFSCYFRQFDGLNLIYIPISLLPLQTLRFLYKLFFTKPYEIL